MNLCKQPIEGVFPVMWEFYVNLLDQIDSKVCVWGKAMPFDNMIINNLYGMSNIPYDKYIDYMTTS